MDIPGVNLIISDAAPRDQIFGIAAEDIAAGTITIAGIDPASSVGGYTGVVNIAPSSSAQIGLIQSNPQPVWTGIATTLVYNPTESRLIATVPSRQHPNASPLVREFIFQEIYEEEGYLFLTFIPEHPEGLSGQERCNDCGETMSFEDYDVYKAIQGKGLSLDTIGWIEVHHCVYCHRYMTEIYLDM